MKKVVRTLCLAAGLALTAIATSHGADPTGSCRFVCSDGSSHQFCDVTYPRCRTHFNTICGGVGQINWQEGGCS